MPPGDLGSWGSDQTKDLKKLVKNRFFTREHIKTWLENEKDLNEREPYEVTITTYDAKGQEHKIVAKGPNKSVTFCSYHRVVGYGHGVRQELWYEPVQYADPGFEAMLVRVTDAVPTPIPAECCHNASRLENMDMSIKDWEKTKVYKTLVDYVGKRAGIMTDVKNMVCFGLGRLRYDPHNEFGHHADKCLLQHYAAVKIRDIIAEKQNKKPEEIPIFAQDPAYCENCKWLLKNKFGEKSDDGKYGIEVVESNSGYLKVDGNTFVMSICPYAPIRQIIGDITLGTGGPAGMLCNIIQADGNEAPGTIVDAESEPLYLGLQMSAKKKGLHKEWMLDPDSGDSAEEESDAVVKCDQDQKVNSGDESVGGCVLGQCAFYGNPR
jgi:hypothetical protein